MSNLGLRLGLGSNIGLAPGLGLEVALLLKVVLVLGSGIWVKVWFGSEFGFILNLNLGSRVGAQRASAEMGK